MRIPSLRLDLKRALFVRLRIGIYTASVPRELKKQSHKVFSLTDLTHRGIKKSENLYIHQKWRNLLARCSKNGGYRNFLGHFFWSHGYLRYFDLKNEIYGGIPDIETECSINCLNEVDYFPNAIEGNNVSKFTFKVNKNSSGIFDHEEGFAFNLSGANYFQHFVQDCYPILAASKVFLNKNSNIPIFMPPFEGDIITRLELIRDLGIKNEIIETSGKVLSVRKLYYWEFKPFPAKYSLPHIFYRILRDELSYINNCKKNNKLILITRKEMHRSFENESEIINKCSDIAKLLNLSMIVINSKNASLQDWKNHISEARVIIGMHGGALFNLVYAKTNTLLFEFVPTIGTDSVVNTLTMLGIKVIPVPIEFLKNQTEPIYIPMETFNEILKITQKMMI